MKIRFVKMHGCGNDYVYIDAINQPEVAGMIGSAKWRELVVRISDRHKGIGSDGVIALCEPTAAGAKQGARVRMRMFNADASEGEMCGNGVRCVAKFAHDRLGVEEKPMKVETGRGVLGIEYEVEGGKVVRATVDMGEPIFDAKRLGLDTEHATMCDAEAKTWTLRGWKGILCGLVSMGNPHAVLTMQMPSGVPGEGGKEDPLTLVREWGPQIEQHQAFPHRTNVHFMRRAARDSVDLFTWERGSGITMACGTGACAVVVCGIRWGIMNRDVRVRVLGGELRIRWDEQTNYVFMTGPAEDVFEGEYRV